MRIFGIGCSHGKLPNLKQFIKENSVDMIFSLGDHCNTDRTRDAQFKNWEKFKGRKYYDVMEEVLGKQYEPVFRELVESGKRVLESLDEFGLPVYVVVGNSDFTNRDRKKSGLDLITFEDIIKNSTNLINMKGTTRKIDSATENYKIIGTPGIYRGINIKNKQGPEWQEVNKEWNENLKRSFSKVKGSEILFIGHDMPYGCDLDKVNAPASPMHGKHVGDEIIRRYIEKYSPVLYMGSHMHEWQDSCKIGKTTVISAGYGKEGKGILIDLPGFELKFVKI